MPSSHVPPDHLRFCDHARFQRTAFRLTAAGAIAGLALLVLSRVGLDVVARVGEAADYAAFSVAAAAFALAALLLRDPVRGGHAAMHGLALATAPAAALVGAWSVQTIGSAPHLQGFVPAPIGASVLCAGLGLIFAVGLAPAHLRWTRDAVSRSLATQSSDANGELADICRRGHASYVGVRDALSCRRFGDHAGLDERVDKIGRHVSLLVSRCVTLDRALEPDAGARLGERRRELETRLGEVSDPTAREHYERALAHLGAQLDQLGRLRARRERGVALLYDKIALLDRARLSLVGAAASDRELAPGALDLVADDLGRAADEMDAEAEVEGDQRPGSATPDAGAQSAPLAASAAD